MNTRGKNLNFLLADDHHIIRKGIQLLIEDISENFEVFHASRLQQIPEKIKQQKIDVVILDAQFPDGNSISILPEIKKQNLDLKVLIFTGLEEEKFSLKYIHAGADGFLSKLSEDDEIRKAIIQLLEDGKYYPSFTQKLLDLSFNDASVLSPLNQLSERELQIAELFSKGYGNLEIANELSLKQNTISTFKKRIFEKLSIESLLELAEMVRLHHGNPE